MTATLEQLAAAIGTSVQAACRAAEESALRLYWEQFDREDSQGAYLPRTVQLLLPVSAQPGAERRRLEVPVTALLEHRSMRLDEVKISLPLTPVDGEDLAQPLFRLGGTADDGRTSTLELTFRGGDAPEGLARLHQRTAQIL